MNPQHTVSAHDTDALLADAERRARAAADALAAATAAAPAATAPAPGPSPAPPPYSGFVGSSDSPIVTTFGHSSLRPSVISYISRASVSKAFASLRPE